MKKIVEAINLSFHYPNGVQALRNINLDIYDTDSLCIIGQNGSGKTTLVRHFNGLLKPSAGKVIVDGNDTKNMTVGELSKTVGYVFQNPNHQIFCKTVMEELEVGPDNFRMTAEEKKKNIDAAIELLNLQPILEKHPLLLDYTSKKILTIASVLTFAPKMLIMDEPTGGLDEEGRKLLKRTIQVLKENGHAVVMISHDMDFVAENMKDAVIMAEGEILQKCSIRNAFCDKEVLKRAWIDPPQITKLGFILTKEKSTILSVDEFVEKFKKQGGNGKHFT